MKQLTGCLLLLFFVSSSHAIHTSIISCGYTVEIREIGEEFSIISPEKLLSALAQRNTEKGYDKIAAMTSRKILEDDTRTIIEWCTASQK